MIRAFRAAARSPFSKPRASGDDPGATNEVTIYVW